ncbi:MAG TPA: hypothetical protein VE866_03025 [Candidatus Binatia bacterium]|nr:hypothetical protein [Candidatus Binatia bacterium]
MKFATASKTLIMGVALLLASSAFAATKANLSLHHSTNVNGTTLSAGDYKLEWDGAGPNVEVSVIQGKKVVAKIPAKLVDVSSPYDNDAAVVKNNGDGSTSLSEARFSGKRFKLAIGDETDGGMQAGSSK